MKKLYRIWDKELEIVEILNEHNLCEGATKETYLCKGKNGKFTCSKDMYFHTELEAWKEYQARLIEGVNNYRKKIEEMNRNIQEWQSQIQENQIKIHILSLPVSSEF